MRNNVHDLPTVAHVSSAHPYTDNRIHYRECHTLVEAGYDVTLIAVESEVEGPASNVRVLTIPKRSRGNRLLFSAIQVIWLAVRSGAEILHLHDPELIPFIPFLRLAGRSVVYDAHEDLPVQVLTKPYAAKWVRMGMSVTAHCLVRVVRSTAHRTIAATEQIASRYSEDRTSVVHNYPPLRIEEEDPPVRHNIVAFVGNMSEQRGTKQVLESVFQPEFPSDWEIHLAGSGNEEIIEAVEQTLGSGRVVFHGKLSPAEARNLLLESRLGIISFTDSPAHRDSLPTKMFEYFAAGLPVIASKFPLWRAIIEEGGCGMLVDPSDPVDIARAVKFYDQSPSTYFRHASNARLNAVEKWNWSSEGAVLIRTYGDLRSE